MEEEEVVEAIEMVDGLHIEITTSHLMFSKEMMTLKKKKHTTLISQKWSAIGVEIYFHQHVDVLQAPRDSYADPAWCVHYGSRTAKGNGYKSPLTSIPSPSGSSRRAEN